MKRHSLSSLKQDGNKKNIRKYVLYRDIEMNKCRMQKFILKLCKNDTMSSKCDIKCQNYISLKGNELDNTRCPKLGIIIILPTLAVTVRFDSITHRWPDLSYLLLDMIRL